MKSLLVLLSSVAIFSMSANAMAGENASVNVMEAEITQIQWGHDQEQEAVIGLVSNEFHGEATIIIKGAKIIQKQHNRHNKQSARIGVVGCDCTALGHGKRPRKDR